MPRRRCPLGVTIRPPRPELPPPLLRLRPDDGDGGRPVDQLPNAPSSMEGRVRGTCMPRWESIESAAIAAAVIHGLAPGWR